MVGPKKRRLFVFVGRSSPYALHALLKILSTLWVVVLCEILHARLSKMDVLAFIQDPKFFAWPWRAPELSGPVVLRLFFQVPHFSRLEFACPLLSQGACRTQQVKITRITTGGTRTLHHWSGSFVTPCYKQSVGRSEKLGWAKNR